MSTRTAETERTYSRDRLPYGWSSTAELLQAAERERPCRLRDQDRARFDALTGEARHLVHLVADILTEHGYSRDEARAIALVFYFG